jgi:dihydrolipoamide dehydrogenase
MQSFDLVLIGTGAGEHVSWAAVEAGMKVAVIEEGPYGGTCVNRGCIPSKMLIRSADVYELIHRAHLWGVNAEVTSIDWQKIVSQVFETVDGWSNDDLRRNEENPNVTNFRHRAYFTGPRTLDVDGEEVRGDIVVIAAGSRPFALPIEGFAGTPYVTTDEALRLPQQPRRLVILGGGFIAAEMAHFFGNLGGGFIAAEMAHFFGNLGTEVTIVQRSAALLGGEDSEVSQAFTKVFQRKFNTLLSTQARKVEHSDGHFTIDVDSPNGTQNLVADTLLVATGRIPNTDRLNLEATGVKTDARGFIAADDYLQTNVEGIWTLGDIAGRYMLRHAANYEASYVAHNVTHPDDRQEVDYLGMPHAVFASPQVAAVGMTEDQARQTGRPLKIGHATYQDVTYGIALRDEDGFAKVIADAETDEILGCHILGTDASILIQEAVNAIRTKTKVSNLANSIYIHPALPELMSTAFYRTASQP